MRLTASNVAAKEVFTIRAAEHKSTDGLSVILTNRETEVLAQILEGKSSKEAAMALGCSKRTVDFHLARIYEKLAVSNRVQAMHRAVALGIAAKASEDKNQ